LVPGLVGADRPARVGSVLDAGPTTTAERPRPHPGVLLGTSENKAGEISATRRAVTGHVMIGYRPATDGMIIQ
jgi:hypothetical protein